MQAPSSVILPPESGIVLEGKEMWRCIACIWVRQEMDWWGYWGLGEVQGLVWG